MTDVEKNNQIIWEGDELPRDSTGAWVDIEDLGPDFANVKNDADIDALEEKTRKELEQMD